MYKCNICGKEFTKLCGLQSHLTQHHNFSIDDVEKYYIDNFKKDGEGIDPITKNKTEFISLQRGYKLYEKDNPKKLATNTVEHYLLKGFSLEEAQSRVKHTCDVSSKTFKKVWENVKLEGKTHGGWSKKHFIELGYTEEEAEIEMKKRSSSRETKMKKHRDNAKSTGEYKSYNNCCIEYYMSKGMSKEDAEIALKIRQTTNTIDNYKKKYGENVGLQKFLERNKNWSIDMEKRYHDGEYDRDPNKHGNGCFDRFTSKPEKELCDTLLEKLTSIGIDNDNIYTICNKNIQWYIQSNNGKYFYDFVIFNNGHKRIIEFNGDYWHMNPEIYESNSINTVLKKTAQEIWDENELKINCAKQNGFDVYIVWENDWYKDKLKIIEECLNFLLDE